MLFTLAVFNKGEERIIDGYETIAKNILEGKGFSYNGTEPTVARAPAYPFLLTAELYLTGFEKINYFALRTFECLIDSISALLLFFCVNYYFREENPKKSLFAALTYSLNPFSAYYCAKLGSETLTIFAFVLFNLFLGKFLFEKRNIKNMIYLIFSGAFLILNKSIFIPVTGIVYSGLIIYYFKNLNKKRLIQLFLIFCFTFLLVLPWTYRNYKVSERFVPVQTLAGFNFWYDFGFDEERNKAIMSGDINKIFTGNANYFPDSLKYHPYEVSAVIDSKKDQELIKTGIKWAMENPPKMITKIIDNFFSFFYVVESPKKMLFSFISSTILIFLAIKGYLSLNKKYKKQIYLIWTAIFLIPLLYTPIFSVYRYSLVIYPLLSIFAGFYIYSWYNNIKSKLLRQ